jgi:general secretion pathway protein A
MEGRQGNLYQSRAHASVAEELHAGIRRRDGLTVLTGEAGVGKTTLCRAVLAALDRKTFTAFVAGPLLTAEDLLKILLIEFGVQPPHDVVGGRLHSASRAELSCPLYAFLRSLEPLDAFAVLILDDAQHLPAPVLDEIRILSDVEGTRRLLHVMLVGEPALSTALQQPHMRRLRQRVTTRCELRRLDRDDAAGYVAHRLTRAGAIFERLHLTAEGLDAVLAASGGVPQVINVLCDRAVHRARLVRMSSIGADLVRAAAADLQIGASRTLPVSAATTETTPAVERSVAVPLRPVANAPRSSTRWWTIAGLIVLGSVSGATLGVYWLWAGPLLIGSLAPPVVKRPAVRISQPLPVVVPPALEPVGDELTLPITPLRTASPHPAN